MTEEGEEPPALQLRKELEKVSIALQRQNAKKWNLFLHTILGGNAMDPEEGQARPRLPSV